MRIETLKAVGLKSGDFEHELGKVNLIVGRNFVGKTARLESVRLALMGYLPELGKQRSSTMQLARNGTLNVSAKVGGDTIVREWTKKGETVAGALPVPPVLLDPSVYFDLGSKDRMRFVFGLLNVDELFSVEKLLAYVKQIRVPDHGEAHEAAVRGVVDMIDESDRERHESERPVQEWIAALLEQVKVQRKWAVDHVARMAKALESLNVVAMDEEVQADLTDRIRKKREALEEAVKVQAGLESELRAVNAAQVLRRSIEQQISQFKDHSDEIVALKAKLEGMPDREMPSPVERDGLKLAVDGILKQRDKVRSDIRVAEVGLSLVRDELAKLAGLECCPTCKASRKGWKAAVEKELVSRENVAIGEVEKVRSKLPELESGLEQAEVAMKEFDAQWSAIMGEITERNRLKDEIHKLETVQMRSAALRQQLANMPAETADERFAYEAKDKVMALSKRCGEFRNELTRLELLQKRAIAVQHEEKRKAQMALEKVAAEATAAVYGDVVKLIEKAQSGLVLDAFESILNRANLLVDGILPGKLQINADLEIGWFKDGTWVSHRTFSGTEKLIAYAGVSMALAKGSPVRILLMDELGRLDSDTFEKLINRVSELIEAGEMDQFIGVVPDTMDAVGGDELTLIYV